MKNMKNMKNILIVFCLIIVGCSGPKLVSLAEVINEDMGKNPPAAGGVSYYVDPWLGNVANLGTKESPWSTLEEVIEYGLIETKGADGAIRNQGAPVKAGDTVILMSGYHGNVDIRDYFNDRTITVQAEVAGGAELGFLSVIKSKNWSFSGLRISPSLEGLEMVRKTIVVLGDDVSDIELKDSYVFSIEDSSAWSQDDWDSKAGVGAYLGRKSTNIVIDNVFFHNVLTGVDVYATNTVIQGSVIANYAKNAIKIRASDVAVVDNIIKNGMGSKIESAIRMDHVDKSAKNVTIRNNIILDRDDIENVLYGVPGVVSYNDELIGFQMINNLIKTEAKYGIILNHLNESNVHNNIIVGTAVDANATVSMSIGVKNTIMNNEAQKMRLNQSDSLVQDNAIMSSVPEVYNKTLVAVLEAKMREIDQNHGLFSAAAGVLKLDLLAMNLPYSEELTNWYLVEPVIAKSPGDVDATIKDSTPTKSNSLTQFGITWVFSEEVEYGQFISGDYYVVDAGKGITILSASPMNDAGENGSMINPVPGEGQGFTVSGYNYNSALSVAFPASLEAGDAFLSSISRGDADSQDWSGSRLGSNSKLKTVAVLTVLSEHPPAGTFRPSYSDRGQTLYNTSQINFGVLPEKAITATSPLHVGFGTLEYFERGMERPWILFGRDWQSRSVHPYENMDNYHEQIGFFLSEASVLLASDIPNKELLINRFIQVGIDYYYNRSDSAIWAWPVVFTGLLLGEPNMYNFWINNPDVRTQRGHEKLYYAEDVEEKTVSTIVPANETWVDWITPAGKHVAFRKQVGLEYEHLHPSEWICYKPDCKSEVYRAQHDVYPLIGLTLSSILVDKKVGLDVNAMLAHDPIRDYADRWMSDIFNKGRYVASGATYIQEMKDNTSFTIYKYTYGNGGSTFINEMWKTHR